MGFLLYVCIWVTSNQLFVVSVAGIAFALLRFRTEKMLLHLHRIFRCTITQQQPFIRNGLPHTRCCASGGIAATEAAKPIKYTDTINLPKTKFPARLTAKKRAEVERRINEVTFVW